MNNTTSILNSFESGSFYRDANYSKILFGGTSTQLNDILVWVNSNFIPGLFQEIRFLNSDSVSESLALAVSLRKQFSDIVAILKQKQYTKREEKSNPYLRDICNRESCTCISNGCGFWRDLQQHEYIETALAGKSKTTVALLNLDVLHSIPNINVSPSKKSMENANLKYDYAVPSSTQRDTSHHSPETNHVKNITSSINCRECECNKNDTFKFNFTVDYDPTIKKILFGNTFIEELDVNGVKQSTIQFRDNNIFACLLCSIEAGYEQTMRTIREHIKGQRHKKNQRESIYKYLRIFHTNWIKMEIAQQAHVAYFFPSDSTVTVCRLCCTYVPYEELEFHLRKDVHMGQVMKAYRKNGRSILLGYQASLYIPGLMDSLDINDNKKVLEARSKQRLIAHLDKEKTDSEESEEEKVDFAVDSKQKNNAAHDIITAIAKTSGRSIADYLEHRFWIHLNLLELMPRHGVVSCRCCEVSIPNHPLNVKEHLYSSIHVCKCNLPLINWHFYCEICDFRCSKDETWRRHYSDAKHIEWCGRLGSVRKSKLCEYECLTCNMVIFGDDLSLRRHARGRNRKKKEVVLSAELKNAFKSERFIQEQREDLVAEANKVLTHPEAMIQCCQALEEALSEQFKKCKVYPFGSRVSGLGSQQSDLDVFVDLGDMYLGMKDQDAHSQEKLVKAACRIFRNKKAEFSHLNPIPTARTPIIQIFHKATEIDCDLSFRHGLSVENSKFLRFCIEVQPMTQSLILILKKWIVYCKLHENITTYALSMLVIYFLQVEHYLLPVQDLKLLNPDKMLIIDGWSITDFSTLHDDVLRRVVSCNKSIKQLLIDFYDFYKAFDYANDVVCPLLGRPIKKSIFLTPDSNDNIPLEMLAYVQKLSTPNGEVFRAKSQFCIQDPFDLSHNLSKACTQGALTKLIAYCDLTSKYLKTIQ